MLPMTYLINDVRVVAMEGVLDAEAVSQLRPFFEELADDSRSVLLDLSEVHFIDSSGIGVMVFLYKRLLSRRLEMEVVGLQPQPSQLFDLLHIHTCIPCHPQMRDYLAAHPSATMRQRA